MDIGWFWDTLYVYFFILKDYHLISTLGVGIPPRICSTLCRPLRLEGPTPTPTLTPTIPHRLPPLPPRPHRNRSPPAH